MLLHKAAFVPFKATDGKAARNRSTEGLASPKLPSKWSDNLYNCSVYPCLLHSLPSSAYTRLSAHYHLCNKHLTPTAKGRVVENQRRKEGKMCFFIKNSLSSIPQGFTSELHERWATMWPHSDQLFTIWKASAEHRRSQMLKLFMMPGPCIYVYGPSFNLILKYRPVYRGYK